MGLKDFFLKQLLTNQTFQVTERCGFLSVIETRQTTTSQGVEH